MSPVCSCIWPPDLISRAPARTHTLASFPPDGVRGGRTLVCVIGIYMYICDLGHSVADPVSAPVAGSDPTPRSASLRLGVGSLNPGSNQARRRRRGTFTRPVSPRRALRRWGAGRPRVLGRSRSQAERLSSGRRVEARSAPLRSVNTPAPQASLRPRAPTSIRPAPPHLRAWARAFVPGRGPRMPLRRRVSDSDGLLPRPRTPGRVRP